MASNAIQRRTQEAAAARTQEGGRPTIQQYIKQMEPAIKAALPAVMTPERFTRITLSALSANTKLQSCTPTSFLGAMMSAAQLGLEPNTPLGQAYLIPYWNKKVGANECQFQIGYKGMKDLAYKGGVIVVDAQTVYEGDDFTFCYGLNPDLIHKPALKDRGDPICFYGMWKSKDGGFGFTVMSVEDVRNHARKFSQSFGSGPWQTNFEEMAKKTALKRALKYAPMSAEFLRAVAQDEMVKNEISEDMYEVQGTYPEADYEVEAAEEADGKKEEKPDPPPEGEKLEEGDGQQRLGG